MDDSIQNGSANMIRTTNWKNLKIRKVGNGSKNSISSRKKSLPAFRILAAFMCLPIVGVGAPPAADPHPGVWKINLKKSYYTGGRPLPLSETITITETGSSYHIHLEFVESDGKSVSEDLTFPQAGGPVEFSGFPAEWKVDHTKASVGPGPLFRWNVQLLDKTNAPLMSRTFIAHGDTLEAQLFILGKSRSLEMEYMERQ